MEDMLRYLGEIVEPTIKDFHKHPSSRRVAFLACVATFHAIDYLAFDTDTQKPRKGKAGNLRKIFGKQSEDFRLVDDVAHAFKHVVSDGRRLRSQDVTEHGGSFSRDFSMDFDISRVTIEGCPEVDLLSTLQRTVAFLRAYSSRTPKP